MLFPLLNAKDASSTGFGTPSKSAFADFAKQWEAEMSVATSGSVVPSGASTPDAVRSKSIPNNAQENEPTPTFMFAPVKEALEQLILPGRQEAGAASGNGHTTIGRSPDFSKHDQKVASGEFPSKKKTTLVTAERAVASSASSADWMLMPTGTFSEAAAQPFAQGNPLAPNACGQPDTESAGASNALTSITASTVLTTVEQNDDLGAAIAESSEATGLAASTSVPPQQTASMTKPVALGLEAPGEPRIAPQSLFSHAASFKPDASGGEQVHNAKLSDGDAALEPSDASLRNFRHNGVPPAARQPEHSNSAPFADGEGGFSRDLISDPRSGIAQPNSPVGIPDAVDVAAAQTDPSALKFESTRIRTLETSLDAKPHTAGYEQRRSSAPKATLSPPPLRASQSKEKPSYVLEIEQDPQRTDVAAKPGSPETAEAHPRVPATGKPIGNLSQPHSIAFGPASDVLHSSPTRSSPGENATTTRPRADIETAVLKPLPQEVSAHELQLNLRSAELGRVEIHAAIKDDHVTARVAVENSAAQKVLASELSGLHGVLAAADLKLDSFTVGGTADPRSSGMHFGGGSRQDHEHAKQPVAISAHPLREEHSPETSDTCSIHVVA